MVRYTEESVAGRRQARRPHRAKLALVNLFPVPDRIGWYQGIRQWFLVLCLFGFSRIGNTRHGLHVPVLTCSIRLDY